MARAFACVCVGVEPACLLFRCAACYSHALSTPPIQRHTRDTYQRHIRGVSPGAYHAEDEGSSCSFLMRIVIRSPCLRAKSWTSSYRVSFLMNVSE